MFPYTYLWYIRISNYKFFIVFGFVVALLFVVYRAHRRGFQKEHVLDIGIISIICGLLGSKLFYVFIEVPNELRIKPWKLIALWESGYVLYGGLFCSLVGSYLYARQKNLSFAVISDLFTPAIALGIGIGRFACLAWGCCYGKAHEGFFSIMFPVVDGFSTDIPKGSPLYPTQVLMILNGFFIFAVILSIEYFDTRGKLRGNLKDFWDFSGTRAVLAIVIYAVNRFFIEFLRADYRGIFYFSLSPSQLLGIVVILIFVPLQMYRYKTGRNKI